MIRTTPFHPVLSELNTQGLYTHWQGYLSALRYTHAAQARVLRGPQRRRRLRHLAPVQVPRSTGPTPSGSWPACWPATSARCRPGQAQYTLWCDDRGFVMEDGVVFRHSDHEFLLTAARPNFGWFDDLRGRLRRRDRGRLRRLRHPRGPGPALARGPAPQLPPEADDARATSGTTQTKIGSRAGHPVAHRLHRRPRVRGHRRGRRTRSTCSTRCSRPAAATASGRSARRR